MTNHPHLDLPRKTRRLLITIGCMGIVLVVRGSLLGKSQQSIGVDKLIHFCAYACLSAVLVLGLSARKAVPGVILLAVISYVVEFLQPFNGRSLDFWDAWANTAGVGVGAGIGLATRWITSKLWSELHTIRMRKSLRTWKVGDILFKDNDLLEQFWVIQEGLVQISGPEGIYQIGPGDVIGLGSELLNAPSLESAVAETKVTAWELDIETLINEAGGQNQPLAAVLYALIKQDRRINEK